MSVAIYVVHLLDVEKVMVSMLDSNHVIAKDAKNVPTVRCVILIAMGGEMPKHKQAKLNTMYSTIGNSRERICKQLVGCLLCRVVRIYEVLHHPVETYHIT